MKNLIKILFFFLLVGCSYPTYEYHTTKKIVPETLYYKVEFKTKSEAKRVQERYVKHDYTLPLRNGNTLLLRKEHIEAKRKVFKKEVGFIREKYRNQLNEQICELE